DLGREPHLRARFDELIEGRIPGLDLALVRRLGRVPDLHQPGRGVGERFMHGLDRVGGEAGKGLRTPEDLIDRTEHVWARAGRMAEAQVAKVVFNRPGERIERPVHDLEFARGRALEREDRLLLVADGENRALDEARAGPREEFAREPPDDVPLLWARVLRFV